MKFEFQASLWHFLAFLSKKGENWQYCSHFGALPVILEPSNFQNFRHQMNTQAGFQFEITILSVIMAFFVLKRGNLATLQQFWSTSGSFRALKV